MAFILPPAASAATAPTVNDDAGKGYVVGSCWRQTSTTPDSLWFCAENAVGAAVWVGPITSAAQLPLGSVWWSGNGAATTITTQGVWTRVAPVAGALATPAVGFDRPANGRLRYISAAAGALLLSANVNFSGAAPNDIYLFGIWKNGGVNVNNEYTSGALVDGSILRLKVGGAGDAMSSGTTCVSSAVANDFFELAVQNTSAVANPTIADANIVSAGHPT